MENLRVLIVEDESIIAEELSMTLKNRGYEILGTASSGRKAIDLAKQNRPDIILMDIRIEGDLNGIETAIIIASTYFEDPVPIVFLTALPSDKFPVLTAVEPYIYVNKPISEGELFSALERAVAKRSL